MTIKYAGPRAIISHHGIDFKDGKEDKYVYLMIGVQILQAIDKDYGEHKSYSYNLETKRVDDDTMLDVIRFYEPGIDKKVEDEAFRYKEHISQEIEKVHENKILKDVEKDVWIKNIEVMKDYRIQRAVNKIYYMHCINNIRNIVKREDIKEIDTPFYEKYWHVLQTLQGTLEEGRYSKHTVLKVIKNEDGQMMAKLTIGF
ncbi:MAG: hypothetical protein KAQ94_07300 [Arcobacteraceae bacterium]|nr:hypothetical protein [Arcobacteraceae bacterium]